MNTTNITGKRSGKLVAVKRSTSRGWDCVCDCGNTHYVETGNFNRGSVKSCGCLVSESAKRGASHRWWKGGKTVTVGGYVRINKGGKNERHILEHVQVVEKHLGRSLYSGETVHHKNGIRNDNRLENLELWDSNHPSGQRVSDLVSWAIQLLKKHKPEVLR